MSVSQAEFVATWNRLQSPKLIAQALGIDTRGVFKRRAELAKKGIFLQTLALNNNRTGSNGYGHSDWQIQAQPYNPRINLTMRDGHCLLFSDSHFWPGVRSLAFEGLLLILKELKPKIVISNGDAFDGASISRHDPLGWQRQPRVIDELDATKNFLGEIQSASPKAKHIFTVGNHDCLDPHTECLTRRGWTPYTDIRQDDEILSLVASAATWTPIDEVARFPFDGELVRVEKNRLSMAVTENHRVLCSRLNWRTAKYDITEYRRADDLPYSFNIPTSGQIDQPEAPITDDQLALAGWILTDGNYGANSRITLYQSKPEGIAQIDALLERMGVEYIRTVRQRQKAVVCGRMLLSEPLPAVEWRLNAVAGRKVRDWLPERGKLPAWQLSGRQFRILLDAIVAGDGVWDGTKPSEKRCAALYGTETFLSSVQAAAVQHGWRARLARDNRGDFRLCLSRQPSLRIEKPEVYREHFSGEVWCLRVPHGNFMVRRNGSAYFTGNSRFDRRLASEISEFEDVPGMHLQDHLRSWDFCYGCLVNEETDPFFAIHAIRGGTFAPRNNVLAAGCTVFTGHLHSQKSVPVTTLLHEWDGVDGGMLADRDGPQFSYISSKPTDWREGFTVQRVDKDGLRFPAELARVVYHKKERRLFFRGEVICARKR